MNSCSEFDPANFAICKYFPGKLNPRETRNLTCDEPVQGRYVTIYMQQQSTLVLCEVEVHGSGRIYFANSLISIEHWKLTESSFVHTFLSPVATEETGAEEPGCMMLLGKLEIYHSVFCRALVDRDGALRRCV